MKTRTSISRGIAIALALSLVLVAALFGTNVRGAQWSGADLVHSGATRVSGASFQAWERPGNAADITFTEVFTVYLSEVLHDWSSPEPEPSPTPPPQEPDIPCLTVVGQHLPPGQPLPPVFAGCVSGGTTMIVWRYDVNGAFIGFDLTVDNSGTTVYSASIDFQRAPSGRILSYGGTVSGNAFPTFSESVVNKYNPQGGLTGANVTKQYTDSGDTYMMDIIRYCPLAVSELTGYQVMVAGEVKTVGSCN